VTIASDTPDEVTCAFLSALDEQRWQEAAALVSVDSQVAFREFFRGWIGSLRDGNEAHETGFASPLSLVGGADHAQVEGFAAEELLARFAEGVHPGNLPRHYPGALDAGKMRITRTLLRIEPIGEGRARAWYCTEWWYDGVVSPVLGGEHEMELIRTPYGWRVRDVDLSGQGGGHILPPSD
jgi:hypothetical protein